MRNELLLREANETILATDLKETFNVKQLLEGYRVVVSMGPLGGATLLGILDWINRLHRDITTFFGPLDMFPETVVDAV